jgi:hypothetical protein
MIMTAKEARKIVMAPSDHNHERRKNNINGAK